MALDEPAVGFEETVVDVNGDLVILAHGGHEGGGIVGPE